MINNKPAEYDQSTSAAVDPAAPALVPVPPVLTAAASAIPDSSPFWADMPDTDELRSLMELVTPDWTPDFGGPGLNDSPPEETPLFTPELNSFSTAQLDPWVSPALADADSFEFPPLFGNDAYSSLAVNPANLTKKDDTMPATIDSAMLYTMPKTPTVQPTELSAPVSSSTRKPQPTGFRKGVTPAVMVPFDAPTQSRTYLSESKTARKEIPAAFQHKAKKRQREEMLDDDEIPADIQDQIEAKRRLNTLAARRSRQRKAQTALENEQRINALTNEINVLQTQLRVVTAERDHYKAQVDAQSF